MLPKGSAKQEIVHEDGKHGLGKGKNRVSTVFEMESILLQKARAVETYQKNPSVRKVQQKNMSKQAVLFCNTGSSWEGSLSPLEYHRHEPVQIPTRSACWTNVMMQVSQVIRHERVVVVGFGEADEILLCKRSRRV